MNPTETSKTTEPWDEPGYPDVRKVAIDHSDLDVVFANGDTVSIPLAILGLGTGATSARVNPEDDGLSVVLETTQGGRIVSGLDLRAASDDAFALEMRRRDADAARRMGLRLKALREDRGINQRDLAALVGMSAPQLSKVESGSYDLRVSTITTLLRAMGSSFADIAGSDAPEISQLTVRRRLLAEGLKPETVTRLASHTTRTKFLSLIEQVFGWKPSDLGSDAALPRHSALPAMQFKSRTGRFDSMSPTVQLAYEVSAAATKSSSAPGYEGVPEQPALIRDRAIDGSGRVTLASLLNWAWSCGIRVIPVAIKGGFAGAAWEFDGVPVITLAEPNPTEAFWLFDLGHEIGHIALRHLTAGSIVDVDEPRPTQSSDQLERDANQFALDLLLPGLPRLLENVRRLARGSHLKFKSAVSDTAIMANVPVGLLGMVAAYELTEIGQNKDRWGSATNLAKADGEGLRIVQDTLRRHLAIGTAPEVDRALVESFVLS